MSRCISGSDPIEIAVGPDGRPMVYIGTSEVVALLIPEERRCAQR